MSDQPSARERDRLEALRQYRILDTPPEQVYDDVVNLASYICGTPIALVTLLDDDRQWFKARVGLPMVETRKEDAFCSHTILADVPMVVPDAHLDSRFSQNPLVVGSPFIRFYAGVPLLTPDGLAMGSLCVIDRVPRELTPDQMSALEALGRQITNHLELRRTSELLAEAVERVQTISGLIPICSYCKQIRNDSGYWQQLETYLHTHTDADFSHGICPPCYESQTTKWAEQRRRT